MTKNVLNELRYNLLVESEYLYEIEFLSKILDLIKGEKGSDQF